MTGNAPPDTAPYKTLAIIVQRATGRIRSTATGDRGTRPSTAGASNQPRPDPPADAVERARDHRDTRRECPIAHEASEQRSHHHAIDKNDQPTRRSMVRADDAGGHDDQRHAGAVGSIDRHELAEKASDHGTDQAGHCAGRDVSPHECDGTTAT